MTKNGVSAKHGTPLRMNNLPRRKSRRPLRNPNPDGNRRERRAYAAQVKQQDKRT